METGSQIIYNNPVGSRPVMLWGDHQPQPIEIISLFHTFMAISYNITLTATTKCKSPVNPKVPEQSAHLFWSGHQIAEGSSHQSISSCEDSEASSPQVHSSCSLWL